MLRRIPWDRGVESRTDIQKGLAVLIPGVRRVRFLPITGGRAPVTIDGRSRVASERLKRARSWRSTLDVQDLQGRS